MHRVTRRPQGKRGNGPLPDGVGGTITGGPLEPIDLMELLNRAPRTAGRGRAVPGAAHWTRDAAPPPAHSRDAVFLSDGTRITFSALDDESEAVGQLSCA